MTAFINAASIDPDPRNFVRLRMFTSHGYLPKSQVIVLFSRRQLRVHTDDQVIV